ncbi:P-loop containing nucleoside triphosphate hydrolase protein [Fimicolochytrium jonesii]|uniref:P-loop containing nucleoside triphosphate hydrolase protein n=1 Tax=Fimicolochytrium jonesii TaxID=1396493 RepID=UPI0022FEFEFD|nr:P-loop containing nucleoside triphosphate hydrolase protein [Fimicolochytrium jonesii]KAI8818742.1 P-loop containing nucleoside triphosphate hydrolase protein [Fimicolochytrium jonesii]
MNPEAEVSAAPAEKTQEPKVEEPTPEPQQQQPPKIFDTTSFPGLGLDPVMCAHLATKLNFKAPTLIQRAALPSLLRNRDKDHVLQAQTGSGKTLAFLLPILHRMLMAEKEFGDSAQEMLKRDLGTLAIVLAPTRELAKQIENVLNSLLKYSAHGAAARVSPIKAKPPTPTGPTPDTPRTTHRHWIVAGNVMGGEKKKSEKARLRRGVTILVSTPGRLLDHLKTTKAFEVGNLRWLVLDEADRLLELGFEETLRDILRILAEKKEVAGRMRKRLMVKSWPPNRQTILCSATIQGGVQKLAEEALTDPEFGDVDADDMDMDGADEGADITVPKQLKQQYLIVPAKLRLVTLVGVCRQIIRTWESNALVRGDRKPCKIMMFVSSTDSVDFHYHILANGHKAPLAPPPPTLLQTTNPSPTPLLPSPTHIYKLHGSLPQSARTAAYTAFTTTPTHAVLFCTDVAARGLDMPDVAAVIQYDPPADVNDYVHRVGRTARLGRQGHAMLFLLPSESEYAPYLATKNIHLSQADIAAALAYLIDTHDPLKPLRANNAKGRRPYELPATNLHMMYERFTLAHPDTLTLAQSAYTSHLRAYATHTPAERAFFHIKNLHLGHIAKAFALRDKPLDVADVENARRAKEKKMEREEMKRREKPGSAMYKKRNEVLLRASASEFGDGGVGRIMAVGAGDKGAAKRRRKAVGK